MTPMPSAFQIIHKNLTGAEGHQHHRRGPATYNRKPRRRRRARSNATKQRFFNHLITAMKAPTLIRAIERISRTGMLRWCSSSRPAKR